ncbi:TetR family transcriptional regulator [Curtobacterium sp. MCBD17_034]|uniref:TetR family transcriptional regulator n=1 Tax=unclassified Curtobacterium TaxID=257496 RepID=UPI000DA7103E|nr:MULTISPECIES: TetR family transcriptional regulator [unclassified Curtobacterium]PZF58563.1 TetR family transcriptional regulator [Curtobacterium sp. MCBD17_034]PZM34552.1 TetR family transcriptional regulator [Curtobacterium sp. MCBD17_031]
MSDTEPGLRERKRRATRLAIQQAAIRIALEQGLAAVTVDEISRRADVSPRTFFNYFPNKEQALSGDDPSFPDDAILVEFAAGGPTGSLLSDVGSLLVHSTQELIADRELLPERQRLFREHPQLFSQRMASMKEFQAQLSAVVERRLLRDHPDGDPVVLARRSTLVALVALAAVRQAWSQWSADEDATLVDSIETAFADLAVLVSRTPA